MSSSPNSRLAQAREKLAQAECNLSPEHKEIIAYAGAALNRAGQFADAVIMQTEMRECNTFERAEDGAAHARVVFEVAATQDMCNAHGMVHGGCSAYLVDHCTSVALVVRGLVTGGALDLVSQSLTTLYHAGAKVGDRLKIVCTTASAGSRAGTARAEAASRGFYQQGFDCRRCTMQQPWKRP
ncbi:hypothetical protein DAEQUDRAFT_737790 [Daedalea quercina L-15889]|uniref:Thioesterase domain-containing protein n=1 Tax=Daedalea quercina L-15889 TaxID=1314783 RepID=A0A165QQ95_9APHY|nr:hypothetical protein DAEQUDRAFT_737790 [Daedalea quercina L-15889]